ncbi:MAG: NAD(P)H-dependent oxidoreductase [Bacteroidetes bacterium]|nr:NAD(P)H-dependent oxidoreductase [Bacteroidota bacterium]
MTKKINILAVSGSTRKQSSNHRLLKAIATMYTASVNMIFFEGLAALPPFNPDDTDAPIAEVMQWRSMIAAADGVLLCTPEYAHGVPGALKNAIDWTVSTNEFSQKPTALITASTDGRFGHESLLETLKTIEAGHVSSLQLLIQFVQTKIAADGTITDAHTLSAVKELMDKFLLRIKENSY